MSKMDTEDRDHVPAGEYAFPKQRKEPIHDAAHVRNAVARFNQVEGVTDEERDEAWKRIKHAASKFNVDVGESSWKELRHAVAVAARQLFLRYHPKSPLQRSLESRYTRYGYVGFHPENAGNLGRVKA